MTTAERPDTLEIDPDTPWGARVLPRLERDRIGWLTTVTPDGQPQSLPIWFQWLDGEVLVYSHRTAVRNRNVVTNPRVSFHLADDGQGDDLVILEGEARIDERVPPASANAAFLAKYGDWIAGYGWTPEWFAAEYPVPILVRPTAARGR